MFEIEDAKKSQKLKWSNSLYFFSFKSSLIDFNYNMIVKDNSQTLIRSRKEERHQQNFKAKSVSGTFKSLFSSAQYHNIKVETVVPCGYVLELI